MSLVIEEVLPKSMVLHIKVCHNGYKIYYPLIAYFSMNWSLGKEYIKFHETYLNMKWGDAHEVSLECP